jgi:hypothetical protein
MSRSYKKTNVTKYKGYRKDNYWKTVRKNINQKLKTTENFEDIELPDPKSIIDDYDYVDEVFVCTKEECYCIKRYGRKRCKEK